MTRCAPGKQTSPVRRRLGWPGIAVMAEELLAVAVGPLGGCGDVAEHPAEYDAMERPQ